ncbi:MAG: hypothetical protein LBV12_11435 [Puniceicoccales bacterium]|jgi:hypothetical protein|nr:hypothetical protein [Puniceicoccales bacterium]
MAVYSPNANFVINELETSQFSHQSNKYSISSFIHFGFNTSKLASVFSATESVAGVVNASGLAPGFFTWRKNFLFKPLIFKNSRGVAKGAEKRGEESKIKSKFQQDSLLSFRES